MSQGLVGCTEAVVYRVTNFQGPRPSAPWQHLPVLCRMLALTLVLFLEPWSKEMAVCPSPLSWVFTQGSPEAFPQGGGNGLRDSS